LPRWLQLVAEATPLYHGVALCRSLTLGQLSAGPDLAHVAYLVVLTAIGLFLGGRTFRARLVT
jgi:lipooligosaccharide transport system permease protein